MKALSVRFVEESSLELHSFLNSTLAESLEPRLRDLDARDGLGEDREGRIPPHTAGITPIESPEPSSSSASSRTSQPPSSTPSWTLKGPPHKWRYLTLSPRPNLIRRTSAVTPRAHSSNVADILRSLQDELFASPAFRSWLGIVSRLMPMKYAVEARRFRPGLDYSLATSEDREARLDVVLGLTPEVKEEIDSDSDEGHSRRAVRGWQAAEWGGWEVCLVSFWLMEGVY